MTNLQEYLSQKYKTRQEKERVKEIHIDHKSPLNKIDGDELDLSEYPNLEIVGIYGVYLKSPLTRLELGRQEKLTELTCSHNQLTYLVITGCTNLKELNCSFNQLTSLDLPNEFNLNNLDFQNNLFSHVNFLTALNPEEIDYLIIYDNNIRDQDLSVFSQFINLRNLGIGSYDKERVESGIYNQFIGSLEPLKKLTKLEFLEISNTDINSGLEYLPDSIEVFSLFPDYRNQSQVKVIIEELRKFDERKFDESDLVSDNSIYLLTLWKKANHEKIKTVHQEEQSEIQLITTSSSKKSKNAKRKEKLFNAQEQIQQLQIELEKEKAKNVSLEKQLENQQKELENLQANNLTYRQLIDKFLQRQKLEMEHLDKELNNLQIQETHMEQSPEK